MRTIHLARLAAWIATLLMLAPPGAAAAEAREPRRVLLLHQTTRPGPFNGKFDVALVEAIRAVDSVPIDIYEEAIETRRFPGADYTRLLKQYLKDKYAGRAIDVIVAQGGAATAFARDNYALFGTPAIVAIATTERIGGAENVTGLQGGFWIGGTVDLALALRPDTRSVVVVDGARDNNAGLGQEIERHLTQRYPGLHFVYLRNLALNDLVSRLAATPEHAIVFLVKQTMRDQFRDIDQLEAVAEIVRASPVPVFSQVDDLIGHGVVGGYVWRFETDAQRMAAMVRQIVNGARPRELPVGRVSYANVVDWRQLERWQIPTSRLPADTVLLYRQPGFLEQYWRYAAAALLIFAALLALIATLLVQAGRRRRAEQQTRQSEARYRSVVDTQSELICRFLPDSTLTFVNDAYCRFWGRARDELVGRKFAELIPPDTRADVLARIGRLRHGIDSIEHRVLLPDGTVGWQHWIDHAIVDESGRLIELQGVGRDITDRKRAEEALGQSEARNSAMLRAIPDVMFVLSRDGVFVDYHARDAKLLYVPAEAFLGRTVADVMPAPITDLFMQAIDHACEVDDPVIVEYDLPMGGLRHFEARLVRAGSDRVLSMVRDVTEARRTAELNRTLAGRLIASQEEERQRIARELHDDVSQKIALLNLEIDQLAGQIAGDETRTRLQEISMHTAAIAADVHDLSHELHPAKVHLVGLAPAVQSLCRDVSQQTGVAIACTHDDLPDDIDRDVSLCLYRVVQEALHNIARHSHARDAELHLSRDDRWLTLQIADSGIGFDPSGGRPEGLGLLSMRERISLLGGQLAIHTFPGGGTRIGVRLPASPPPRDSRSASSLSA